MRLLERTCDYEQMNVQRLIARGFVVAGGLFWITVALAGTAFLDGTGLALKALSVAVPLVITVVIFAVGMFYEVLAAALLGGGALIALIWGLVSGWETGVWTTMLLVLVAPMVIASALYLLASRMQNICELKEEPAGVESA